MYDGYVRLAEKLCRVVPGRIFKMAIFANSGAEAVENAVKVAPAFLRKDEGIIAFANAFHGRTYMAMTLTSKVIPYKVIQPHVRRLQDAVRLLLSMSPSA